jgi:two-component system nitrogen regulation sensor histidine kinase NtrY
VRDLVAPDVLQERVDLVEVYRVSSPSEARPPVVPVLDVAAPSMPRQYSRASADRLAEQAAASGAEARAVQPLSDGGDLIRTAMPIRSSPSGPVRGVVVASEYLTDQFATRARGMTAAYEAYQQLRVLKQPLAGVYLSFFLMLTLMILVGSTWMGLYLAKRITRPVQMLATAADEIGAGRLDHRVKAETSDEFGSLIDAFNRMAGDLAANRRRLERSSVELERKHHDVEGRRRYVETVLDRLATGVVSIDAAGSIRTWNAAASRLLGIDARVAGLPASAVFGTRELKPLALTIDEAARNREDMRPQDVSVTLEGREVHLAVMTTPLRRDDGTTDGMVVVFDDVSPLIRAQKAAAWREVARRLAHEIKNPLTPIQLCAERLRRHFTQAPEPTRALVEECTATIVGEVESLKGLVDEFSQFARMPAPRSVPTDLHVLLDDALALYQGLFTAVEFRRKFADGLPKVGVDQEQIRRVVINLVDNAIEAMDRRGAIDLETQHDRANNVVRIVVGDNGPGIPAAEREKLFLPYYSTKQRGSGLGLAIVRRIVAEHGGTIAVTDNAPRGTRFAIELPA